MRCFSTSVTLARTAAAMYAETRPAEPPPMTIRLRSKRRGRGQRAYTRRALMASSAFFARSGKIPSSTKAPISAGERICRGVAIAASCVPAFTYTSVPASMPTWLTQ